VCLSVGCVVVTARRQGGGGGVLSGHKSGTTQESTGQAFASAPCLASSPLAASAAPRHAYAVVPTGARLPPTRRHRRIVPDCSGRKRENLDG